MATLTKDMVRKVRDKMEAILKDAAPVQMEQHPPVPPGVS